MVALRFAHRLMGIIFAVGSASCGSNDSTSVTDPEDTSITEGQTIELLSYWGMPGQTDMVQALIDLHKSKHPGDQIINDGQQTTNWDALLAERIAAGNTPDLYVQQAADLASFIQKHGANSLQPLDEFLAAPSQAAVLPNLAPELIAKVTVNGKIYGMPSGNVGRANALFHNKMVFAAHQLSPPTTIEEFLAVCQTLKTAGVNCITTTYQTLLFEGLLAGAMGIDAYYSYRSGGVPDEAALRQGIDVYAEVIDNYLDPAALRPVDGTQDAEVSAFMNGQAAMYAIGDWTKSMLPHLGWTPGVDYGITAAPGNAGLFVYAADVLTIPAGAPHPEGALSFLETVATLEGQRALNGIEATPTRNDMQVSTVDPEQQGIIADWRQAKYRLAANTTFSWEGPLQAFVHTVPHDKEALLQFIMKTY